MLADDRPPLPTPLSPYVTRSTEEGGDGVVAPWEAAAGAAPATDPRRSDSLTVQPPLPQRPVILPLPAWVTEVQRNRAEVIAAHISKTQTPNLSTVGPPWLRPVPFEPPFYRLLDQRISLSVGQLHANIATVIRSTWGCLLCAPRSSC